MYLWTGSDDLSVNMVEETVVVTESLEAQTTPTIPDCPFTSSGCSIQATAAPPNWLVIGTRTLTPTAPAKIPTPGPDTPTPVAN